jgi:hypothetical protein
MLIGNETLRRAGHLDGVEHGNIERFFSVQRGIVRLCRAYTD